MFELFRLKFWATIASTRPVFCLTFLSPNVWKPLQLALSTFRKCKAFVTEKANTSPRRRRLVARFGPSNSRVLVLSFCKLHQISLKSHLQLSGFSWTYRFNRQKYSGTPIQVLTMPNVAWLLWSPTRELRPCAITSKLETQCFSGVIISLHE